MSINNINRLGYRKTKNGWIPENWDIIKIETKIVSKIKNDSDKDEEKND